jgi:hypothetical protein
MHDRSAATYKLDYWTGPHAVQLYCGTHPPETETSPALLVGLSAIGEGLKARYDAIASPVPSHLSALLERMDAHLQPRPVIAADAHLQPASIVAVAVYSCLLASGLIAHAMGFPRFSTEPRAKSFLSINVPAPLASEVETIGHR